MRQLPTQPHERPRDNRAIAYAVIGLVVFCLVVFAWLAIMMPQQLVIFFQALGALIIVACLIGILIGAIGLYNQWAARHAAEADKRAAFKRAEVQTAPYATSYHYEVNTATTAGEQLALPAPIDVLKPLNEWLEWVDAQPHTLLGGKTKAGKTWLATALLERRIDNGSDIFIIDPHSSDWMGLPTAGGKDIKKMRAALLAVRAEYDRRMAQREEHKRRSGRELPHDYFTPLTVLIDEANDLYAKLASDWKDIVKEMASGSRKVSMGLLMLAQSPLVEDLGITGAMRENFSRIALDDRIVQGMIDNERDKPRKDALNAMFKSLDWPAAAHIGPLVWLLDRRGLAPGNASASVRMWGGWDYTRNEEVLTISPTNEVQNAFGSSNEPNEKVRALGAEVSSVLKVQDVPISADERAFITSLNGKLKPSAIAKRLPGYTAANYKTFRAKVDQVLSEEVQS